MRALVPAGGKGTRLRPLTHTSAKQLVPVANEPILSYVLRDIADAGITEVGLVVGDTAREIEDAVGDGSAWGLSVTYLPQDAPRGLAHTVQIARDFLGDDPFVMYLGDNMLRDGIASLVDGYGGEGAHIMVASVPDPAQFGVVELDGDRVVRVVEKPADPPSDLALVGVYLFGPAVHDAVATLQPSARGELEITEAIQTLIDHGHEVGVHRVTGWWKDTGHRDDLLEANRFILDARRGSVDGVVEGGSIDGTAIVAEGARLEGCTVRGPVIIGERTVIRGSTIGPYVSIGPDCRIEGATISDSIVMEECVITTSRPLERCLLGRGVAVESAGDAASMMVGDHGRVDL